MKAKTALVTGAAGFLGKNTAIELQRNGIFVAGMGHGEWSTCPFSEYGISEWTEADVTLENLSELQREFDLIVHCAGAGSVGHSLSHPMDDFNRTVNSTLAVLEYMRIFNKKARLIYPSSAAVYGLKEDRPIRENERLCPFSPYGYHKKISEELCESYSKHFGLKVSIIRFFSLYGNGLQKQLIWEACKKFAEGDDKVIFFGSGEETRDWLHIHDAVNLILSVSGSAGICDIFNGGSGQRLTVKEVLEFVAGEFSNSQTVLFNGEVRKGDPKYYLADISRAESLPWRSQKDWRSGIREYIQWFREKDRSL